ncbi:SGNH/GDSL hydrolase family protein [Amycolatopsis rhizosphaerae]|uniref:SGNH/GDSL hydrolase family protein n=1 Tax=Amycolatopsis rhizosphaerae TaxID=2053003 RepID=A0A558A6I0_9PSEU|nr:SGNH/GDSL hydrolase family protein [Amycolatopsis rhizosphaerae]TVT19884.1 SGNH/GDSL hydrolase family protein [Amycolatopsis rhizosphaerae]
MTDTTTALTEETDPLCLPPTAAARLLTGAPWRRFGVIGDSLAAGTGDPSPGYATLPWGTRVADVLRRANPGLAYRNTGTIGATIEQTLAEQAEGMLSFGPDLLHLSCGGNDLWRREPDFAAIEDSLRRLYRLAAGSGALLITFTLGKAFDIPKFPDFPVRVRRLNDLIRTVAAEHRALVVDMWDHEVNTRPGLLSADRIHFSASGQAVMAAEVLKALSTVLPKELP